MLLWRRLSHQHVLVRGNISEHVCCQFFKQQAHVVPHLPVPSRPSSDITKFPGTCMRPNDLAPDSPSVFAFRGLGRPENCVQQRRDNSLNEIRPAFGSCTSRPASENEAQALNL